MTKPSFDCDGMDDWQKMSGLPAFSHLFAKNERQVENPFSQPQGDLEPAPAPAAVQNIQQPPEEDDVLMSGPDAAADGLFANVDAQQSTPRVDDPSALKDQRNENSVLFSLDALDAAAQKARSDEHGWCRRFGFNRPIDVECGWRVRFG